VKKIFIISCSILSALIIGACSSSNELESLPADVRYQRAKEMFDDEKYLEAIEEFKIVTVQFQGSEFADDAQFYLAESRFLRGEYILAAAEYDNLVRMMPTSPFVAASRYKKAESHYRLSPKPQLDQKYSRYAIDDFQTYLEYAPNDSLAPDAERKIVEMTEKLARKLFDSGRLYYRMNYYKASIAYFDKVISEYNDTEVADDALLWKARSQMERKDYTGALTSLDELRLKFPSTDLQKEIDELAVDIRKEESEFKKEKDRMRVTNE
jgi:outer membrane protein assembly factor BamD